MLKIAPSILAADFSKLAEEVKCVDSLGADYIHIDVMDGHFVPNITLGPGIVKCLRPHTELPFDVHLMIENPDQYIKDFKEAGADIITVHVEACRHLHRTLQLIKQYEMQCGVVLNPHTPLEMIKHVLQEVDWILIMSVNPGFGGQTFIPDSLNKIATLNQWRQEQNLSYVIEVDGGVNEETSRLCEEAGADVVVAGSAVFNAVDRQLAIQKIKG
ncbi:ribulose-phosphate 3-epimerase [Turicibacter bilis]|uniref:Ribulose-phosphate 3-epimerase n=1 Tax=Turicibacter bilis TaxID=2735723 RepID=A0A9Q9CG37_9FIRM|nr:ribulose-phosphate 3-epimerase [Turicibacter bilis]MBS3197899.1 ribulose-phosphate 3-epimerase [Turicibacter bilis]UUF08010.1 ribulose-phosphate 3-epimerase [Turicibacter bilis]